MNRQQYNSFSELFRRQRARPRKSKIHSIILVLAFDGSSHQPPSRITSSNTTAAIVAVAAMTNDAPASSPRQTKYPAHRHDPIPALNQSYPAMRAHTASPLARSLAASGDARSSSPRGSLARGRIIVARPSRPRPFRALDARARTPSHQRRSRRRRRHPARVVARVTTRNVINHLFARITVRAIVISTRSTGCGSSAARVVATAFSR